LAFIVSTFLRSFGSINGPFFRERDIVLHSSLISCCGDG
jgi:hypothetical protein